MTTLPPGPPIARGHTAEIYAWQEGQVLKLFYEWCPPDWIQREIQVGQVLVGSDLPTPRFIENLQIDGRQGIVYTRVAGISFLRLCAAKPWLIPRLARQFADLHAQVHQLSGAGLPTVRDALRHTIQRVENLPPDLMQAVLQVLDRLPDQPGLCHYDFHPDQVLLTDQGPVIIDWMTACQGHPLADVARSAIIFTYFPLPPGNPLRRVLLDQGKKLFFRIYQNSYLRRYRTEHPQYTRQELDEWLIPVAAGRLREDIPGEREPILAFLRRSLAQ